METNVGRFDATARWLLATAFFLFSIAVNDRPAISLAFAALAVVMIATALTRKCPFYGILGINTRQRAAPPPRPAGHGPRRAAETIQAGR